MNWIIKIEGRKFERIEIAFDPFNEELIFLGEFKIKLKWNVFCEQKIPIKSSAEDIMVVIERVTTKLTELVNVWNELNEGFSVLNLIEIKNDDEVEIKNETI